MEKEEATTAKKKFVITFRTLEEEGGGLSLSDSGPTALPLTPSSSPRFVHLLILSTYLRRSTQEYGS